jgi:hypothetical protein
MHVRPAVTILSLLLFAPSPLRAADDLRIETRLYDAGEKDPFAVISTLFHDNEVFDYLEPAGSTSKRDGEATIFQPRLERFVVLSPRDKIYTTIRFGEIQSALEKKREVLRQEAQQLAAMEDPRAQAHGRNLAFLADPEFTEQYSEPTGVLLLASPLLTYRVATAEPRHLLAVDRIRELTDWQAKLNHLLHGSMPPYPRFALNAALAKRGRIATEIRLTIATDDEPVQIRAQHEMDPSLRAEHYRRIETTRRQMQEFKAVSFLEYVRRRAKEEPTASKAGNRKQ